MRESCVGAFARARIFALAAVGLLVGAGSLLAQSTGKLEGRIRDQAGAPIPSAQVRIEGTAFGAVADARGYWFINNVPAGSVDLVAQFVGYRPVKVTGLRVLAGQTITQDFALEQSAIVLEDITTVAAVNVLVPRDAVTTKQNISGEFTENLPVDRINNVIALQPGVVVQNNGAISIRGGRTDEAAVYIDGVPVTPGGRGGQFQGTTAGRADVSTVGFEQASVTTGASSSEFGNAQSGIIAIETKSGGSKWAGSFGYENDEIGGLNHSLGFNRVQASVGGPLIHNLTLHVGGDLEGSKSGNNGIDGQKFPIFVPVGVDTTVAVLSDDGLDTARVDVSKFAMFTGDCDAFKKSENNDIANNYGFDCRGARVPANANSSYRVNAKLQFTYGTGSRIAVTAIRSTGNTRNFTYGNLTAPENLTGAWNGNNVMSLNWTQNLSKSADRALALEVYGSYQWDRAITGPLTRQAEQDTRDPFGGFIIKPLDFLFDFDNFDIAGIAQSFRLNNAGVSPYDILNPTQYIPVDEFRNSPYASSTQDFITAFQDRGGPSGRISLYKEDRAIGKANLDWQVDRYNRIKLGGEYTKYYMNAYTSGLTSQAFSDGYHEQPKRWNAFVEDRLDLGDLVLVGGLRYDWYKSGASRPYSFLDTDGNIGYFPRISSAPGFDPANPTAPAAGCERGGPVAAACVNQYAGMVEDKSHNYLSPHVQVSFPVTERTNFRLSYAHQVQAPDFQLILGGVNTDLAITNTNHVYGTDLDFGRTITFEFGIRHSFNDDMVLDISAYNKDKLSDATGRLVSFFDPQKKANVDIRAITNADFGNARGIDIRFDRRVGELFNGTLAYTFEEAKNTGSDPFTYINFGSRILNALGGGNNPPPQAILTTNQNRPHTLAGQLALNFPNNWKQGSAAGSVLENVGLFATFRFASGTAYSRCPTDVAEDDNVFAGTVCSREVEGDYNGARLPMRKEFDLRATKGFGLGGLDFVAYATVQNLFNFSNINTVFTQTNDITNNAERDRVRTDELDSYGDEATRNGVRQGNGTIDLRFAGAAASGCGSWVTDDGKSAPPNCVYMIRTEQRYGNGDGLFTVAEQTRAVDALYYVFRGVSSFTGAPRRIRLGFEVNF